MTYQVVYTYPGRPEAVEEREDIRTAEAMAHYIIIQGGQAYVRPKEEG